MPGSPVVVIFNLQDRGSWPPSIAFGNDRNLERFISTNSNPEKSDGVSAKAAK